VFLVNYSLKSVSQRNVAVSQVWLYVQRNRCNRDDAVVPDVQTGRLRVKHDPAACADQLIGIGLRGRLLPARAAK
jgi:hypothetical protein